MPEIDARVQEAARRAAEEKTAAANSHAQELNMQSILQGRQGGSRTLAFLADYLRSALKLAMEAADAALVKFAPDNVFDYRDSYAALIRRVSSELVEIFKSNGAVAIPFGRTSEHEVAELQRTLRSDGSALLEEFDLAHEASRPTHSQSSDAADDMRTAILRIYARDGKSHKINVLGRPYQAGALEAALGVKFDTEQRASAARAFSELLSSSLLQPTYDDIADPENWLVITEKGKNALSTGTFDRLDGALNELSPSFVTMRRGAWATSLSVGVDAPRQAAHSGRELLAQVLRHLAPDVSYGERLTRKERVRMAIKQRPSGTSGTDVEVIEHAASLVDSLYNKLSGIAHGPGGRAEVNVLLRMVDLILELLLF